MNTLILIISLLFGVGCGSPPGISRDPEPAQEPSDPGPRELRNQGQLLFQQHCARCHGAWETSSLLSISRERFDAGLARSYHRQTLETLTLVEKDEIFLALNFR